MCRERFPKRGSVVPGGDKRLDDIGLAGRHVSGYAWGSWSGRMTGRQRLRPACPLTQAPNLSQTSRSLAIIRGAACEARLPSRNMGLPQCKSHVGNRYPGRTRQPRQWP
jgi:hypothetical protein